jgi:hypothetical protein
MTTTHQFDDNGQCIHCLAYAADQQREGMRGATEDGETECVGAIEWNSGFGPDLPAAGSYVRVACDGATPEWALIGVESAKDGWRVYCASAQWHDADADLTVRLFDRDGDEIDTYSARVVSGRPVGV